MKFQRNLFVKFSFNVFQSRHILNYDFPRHAEEYVHRVGRTGRAGRTGIAISFMTREDWSKASDLIDILKEANQVRRTID